MKANFSIALKHIFESEGGYQEDSKDSGNRLSNGRSGSTNLGVTQAVWEEWVGHPVSKEDMRNLRREGVERLYRKKYWDVVQGDDLPVGLDFLMLDFAINAGPGRAIKTLQEALGVTTDGNIGPKTAYEIKRASTKELIKKFTKIKDTFYKECRGFPTYGKGWLNRSAKAEALANTMIG
jgi:lysozyme family protein